jgi:hypothetical protein
MKKIMWGAAIMIVALVPLWAQTLTVVAPNGGEVWTLGSTAVIRWTMTGTGVTTVRLILFHGGTGSGNNMGVIASGLPAASGSYSWAVGSFAGGIAGAGGNYYIRVHAEGQAVDDFSDGPFTISTTTPPTPSLTLTSPNGGESWVQGSDQAISWTASDNTLGLRLVLLKDGQVLGTVRDNLGSNGGSVPWKAGEYQGGLAAPGSGYKVRLETTNGQYSDASNGTFTITVAMITKVRPVQVQALAKKPDLIVCLTWDGERPALGNSKTIKVRVKNVGPGPSLRTDISVYVEGHGTHRYSISPLQPNGSMGYDFHYSWSTVGHKTVRAIIDPDNLIEETNENNNQIENSISVRLATQDRYTAAVDKCSDGTGY